MIAVKKETLKDSLTRILWYYLNNDFNLNMVARELFSRESAALALQTGHSVDEFLKSGASHIPFALYNQILCFLPLTKCILLPNDLPK